MSLVNAPVEPTFNNKPAVDLTSNEEVLFEPAFNDNLPVEATTHKEPTSALNEEHEIISDEGLPPVSNTSPKRIPATKPSNKSGQPTETLKSNEQSAEDVEKSSEQLEEGINQPDNRRRCKQNRRST